MTVATIISWMFCGLFVGLIARKMLPGLQDLNLLTAAELGIVGACVEGFVYFVFQGQPDVSLSLAGDTWHGWIVSVIGALLVLWLFPMIQPRKWWQS